jgi:hypothetical protein
LARAGVEANFEQGGTEYRLGAELYSTGDYLNHVYDAGFRNLTWRDYVVDERLIQEVPWARKYLDRSLLLLIRAERAA